MEVVDRADAHHVFSRHRIKPNKLRMTNPRGTPTPIPIFATSQDLAVAGTNEAAEEDVEFATVRAKNGLSLELRFGDLIKKA